MSAGKGDSPRPVNWKAWDACPLWKNAGPSTDESLGANKPVVDHSEPEHDNDQTVKPDGLERS